MEERRVIDGITNGVGVLSFFVGEAVASGISNLALSWSSPTPLLSDDNREYLASESISPNSSALALVHYGKSSFLLAQHAPKQKNHLKSHLHPDSASFELANALSEPTTDRSSFPIRGKNS
ncbi:hypothetical protein AgCh_006724 [Apium graveolens]